jgi:hypothetical protein
MKVRSLAGITAALIMSLALEMGCWCQDKLDTQDHPKCLIVLPSAFEVKYTSFEGTTQLVYRSYVDYPAKAEIKTISKELRREGWKPLESDYWNPTIPSSHQTGWAQFEDHTKKPKTTVNQWMAQWQNAGRDVVSHTLQYRYPTDAKPELNTLRVVAIFIPAALAEKMPKTPSK